jgi:hypothetical protein
VPETADFLRPQNPDSLFQDRAKVALDENHQQIYLRVPAVESKKLPALWRVKAVVMDAASTADRLALNSEAFTNPLILSLESEGHTDTQRVLGPEPWGLFDMERGGGLVNPNRDVLPIASYVLLSSKPIQFSRKGFEETENPINEQFELVDGTICSITRLLPTGKNAELLIEDSSQTRKTIQFKTKARIEARFYAGESRRAGFFNRKDGITRVEQWPVLCVSIPNGYFRNDLAQLNSGFKVYIDNDLAGGKWESKPVRRADDRNYYLWKWSSGNPVMRQTGERASSLQDIGKIVSFPDLRGKRTLAIKSMNFTEQYEIEMLSQVPAIAESWKNLPGSYLPMFLLCQSDVGLKWEDLLLVKDVIAPDSQISYHVLRKYYEHGILVQRNRKWSIEQSRYALNPFDDVCQLDYCGDPSILWGLYRRMHDAGQGRHSLPVIEIVNKRGKIPYLHMDWPMHFQLDIEKYLKNHRAIEGDTLWMH